MGFKGTEYQNLHKVYSIWIMLDWTDSSESYISYVSQVFHGDERLLTKNKSFKYDFIELVFISIGKDWCSNYNGVCGLFGLWFSNYPPKSKIRRLEDDFGVISTKQLEEVTAKMGDVRGFYFAVHEDMLKEEAKKRGAEIAKELAKEMAEEMAKEMAEEMAKEMAIKMVSDMAKDLALQFEDDKTKENPDTTLLYVIRKTMKSLNVDFETALSYTKYSEEEKERLRKLNSESL